MTDIPGVRTVIQAEEVAFNASVSEATAYRMGQQMNHITFYQNLHKDYNLNGEYSSSVLPNLGMDGLVWFPWPWEIVTVGICSGIVGTGGITELDLKWKPQQAGSYASIFSTTPKFTNAANNFDLCRNGQSFTGFVAPVLSKTTFAANDLVRMDLLQVQSGTPSGAYLRFFFRPL